MKKIKWLIVGLVCAYIPLLLGAFDASKPAASTSLRASNPEILANWVQLQTALNNEHIFSGTAAGTQTGDHTQGSARCFWQSTSPTTRIDTDTFLSTDLASVWIDSDDNSMHILTTVTPTWTPVSTEIIATLLASDRTFASDLAVGGSLAVTASATIGSTLDVTGILTTVAASVLGDGSTLAAATESGDGVRTIADKSYVDTGQRPVAKIYLTSAQNNVANGSWVKVDLDTSATNFDATIADLVTANKITPAVDGLYAITGTINCINASVSNDDQMMIAIYKNGSLVAKSFSSTMSASSVDLGACVSTLLYMDTNDYIQLYVRFDNSGATIDLAVGEDDTYLTLLRVGAVVP